MSKGYLVLESGEIFEGLSHGGENRAGEVVFNTSHSGYEEMATDPSYYSQILVMTAPMQGNYGVDRQVWESKKLMIEGFVSLEIQNSLRDSSWRERLIGSGIPVLTEIDTRKLVFTLRDQGTAWGAIVQCDHHDKAKELAFELIETKKKLGLDWVAQVSCQQREISSGHRSSGPRVAVVDFGVKENIVRILKRQCSEVAIFPYLTLEKEIRSWEPDGILLSNGPGDPAQVDPQVQKMVKNLLGWRPIFGICMGHQILSQTLGAKTFRLKFGHRGGNHPVKDLVHNDIYVTSQNHGFAVVPESLPTDVFVTHTNLNDGTVEGIEDPKKKCMGVQFHPESHPGPRDGEKLLDMFLSKLK